MENTILSGNAFNLLDDIILPPKEEKKEVIDENTPRYIINSKTVDTFTVKRTRNLLTPAVCDKCGLDLAALAYSQNKLETPVYADLLPEIQTVMRQVVQKHKQVSHTTAEDLIVTSKPKEWLSGRR
jgi:hypothetical protein